jgi:hypothetical protein
LYRAIKDISDTQRLQEDLTNVNYWCKNNNMELNPHKSTCLTISKSPNSITNVYNVGNIIIPSNSDVKCLGVHITDDLKWNHHVDMITNKAFRVLGMLRRSLTGTRRSALRTAYLTLVRPIILFASPSWHPVTQANLKKLENVQNAATRLILGRDSYYYINGVKHIYGQEHRNAMCHLPSIKDVLYRNDMIFLHKCMLGLVDLPVFGINRISIRTKPRMLRGGDSIQYVVPTIQAGYYNDSFFPRSVHNYNKLSDAIRQTPLSQFKSGIL